MEFVKKDSRARFSNFQVLPEKTRKTRNFWLIFRMEDVLLIFLNKLSVFTYSNTNLHQLFCEKLQNLKPKSERVSFCVNSWKLPAPINNLHEPGSWLSWRIPRLMIIMMVILMILWLYYGVKWYVPTQYNQPNKKK